MKGTVILMDFMRIEGIISYALSDILTGQYKLIPSRFYDNFEKSESSLICFLNDNTDSFSEELGKSLDFCFYNKIKSIIAIVNNSKSNDALILKEMKICSVASMNDSVEKLKDIIHASLKRNLVYSEPCSKSELADLFNHISKLSLKEKRVIGSLMDGLSVTDIACKEQLSTKTISTHKFNAMKKLGLKKKYDFLKLNRMWLC